MRILLSALVAGLICLASPAFAISVSASLPLDSWVYPALDKLAGMGLIHSSLKGSRPYTRLEAARLTLEAREQAAVALPPPVAFEILYRLERELRTSLDELRDANVGSYFQPLREVRLDYFHQQALESTPTSSAGSSAIRHTLNANNFGIAYADGHNLHGILDTEARFHRFLLLNWRPLFSIDEDETDQTTLQGTATLGVGPISVIVGRDSLWWGQGRHGSLILTNNAKPLDMLRVANQTPVLLPWFFKYLGPFRFDVFWSELEADRQVPEPSFSGLRVNFKPRPWLEIGGSRTLIYGGEGVPKVRFSEVISAFGGKKLSGEEKISTELAAIDARLVIAPLWRAEIYGEIGVDDATDSFLVGLYLPRIEPSGRLGLRLEYADIRGSERLWSQYAYEKNGLGHHVSGDSRDYFAAFEWFPPGQGLLRTGVEVQRRGLSAEVVEKHVQPFIQMEQPLGDAYRLSARYGFDRVTDADHVQGRERTDRLASFGISRTW